MSIISGLKELFTHQEQKHQAHSENPNFVTRPSRVIHMLKLLEGSATQITVTLSDGSAFPSKILRVEKDALILDQFISSEAHKKINANQLIDIQAKQHGVPFNFKTSVHSTKPSKLGGYKVSLPEKIYYPQKRAFFRVLIARSQKVSFNAAVEFSENTLTGNILDISLGGLSLGVYNMPYLKKGSILSPVNLVVGEGENILCDLTVRSLKEYPREGYTRVGCQFLNLDSPTKLAINQFINSNERKRAKKER